jgi:isoaspartyl peptidase/L-asparaginase-like protein (Ntn-hydrolase superfamily)
MADSKSKAGAKNRTRASKVAIAIHGGAGTLPRARLKPQREAQLHDALEAALRSGYELLAAGESSMNAVTAAVMALEDCPLFNAGHGAVFNRAGEHELDAAIMQGRDRDAGAVTGARRTRNPIRAARAVMEYSEHVLLAGSAADEFAQKQGLDIVSPDYFSTHERFLALERTRKRKAGERQDSASAAERHGTVGAVALDCHGDLAAGTSTGGFTDKMPGRVGDSPIIGAGTYADNATCAVSATGDGEFFIRSVVAYDVSARMRYRDSSLAVAARAALAAAARLGGTGGLVAVDARGRLALPFNTEGMYRAYVNAAGECVTQIFTGPGRRSRMAK